MEKNRGQAVKLQIYKERSLIKYFMIHQNYFYEKHEKNKNKTDV